MFHGRTLVHGLTVQSDWNALGLDKRALPAILLFPVRYGPAIVTTPKSPSIDSSILAASGCTSNCSTSINRRKVRSSTFKIVIVGTLTCLFTHRNERNCLIAVGKGLSADEIVLGGGITLRRGDGQGIFVIHYSWGRTDVHIVTDARHVIVRGRCRRSLWKR